MSRILLAPASALLVLALGAAHAATPQQPYERGADEAVQEAFWAVGGGELKLRVNDDFLELFGIRARLPAPAPGQDAEDHEFAVFAVSPAESLHFNAPEGGFDRFVGGGLRIEGGFALDLAGRGTLDQRGLTLRAGTANPMQLELVGADGTAWFYLNHLMYKMVEDYRWFYVRSADLRASKALADRIGRPELADAYVGEVKMLLDVVARPAGFDAAALRCPAPNFHGLPLPGGGGSYRADVLMEVYTMAFTRCRRGDTQANGCNVVGDDGQVVFTPSSTLRNSNRDDTADVPWYQKFTVSPYNYPYPGNDQHPYLIWNMFRLNDGQLEQIGASGVKHAFLTINTGCAPGACTGNGHILGRNCGDVYGTGNNDSNSSLGPRHELVPATGEWGRCRSIYDVNCDGVQNSSGNTNYDQRLIVRESQMRVPGAQFFTESWYIVQDDVDIYNTMAFRPISPSASGSGWTTGSQGAFTLGPVINHWVNPAANPTRNVEIATPEGHVRVAVAFKDLGACGAETGLSGNCWRYDYVVNNFDFSRVVYGNPPNHVPPNLEVVSNKGFDRFSIPVAQAGVHVPAGHFADLDIQAGNDWTVSQDAGNLTWSAPVGNELNWGTLYRFSFVTNVAPDPGHTRNVALGVAGPGEPAALTTGIMVPNVSAVLDLIFAHDFEGPAVDRRP
ncbi:MAG: hypothetical protein U0S76_05255 [Pseudoxanthomonas sp.]|nr:hypothetical protein [Pseudoxanthomonas sp.]